ncbi:MAG: hypothetical protein RL071_5129 [Pseudomonadota bacterium]|jgi:signal peptidase I
MDAPDEQPSKTASAGSELKSHGMELVKSWGPMLLGLLLVRSMVFEPFRIPSGSMVPTLEIGDHIVITKSSYGFRWPLTRIPMTTLQVPARGDIVVFVYPGSDTGDLQWIDLPVPPFGTYDYVKRVVGLPGERVEVRDNVVHINGVAQQRSYVDQFTFVDDGCSTSETKRFVEDLGGVKHDVLQEPFFGKQMGDFGPTVVPEGHVFVMGDNRDHSADSRVWGFVPLKNIKGKAQFVWMSLQGCEERDGELRPRALGVPRWDRAGVDLN